MHPATPGPVRSADALARHASGLLRAVPSIGRFVVAAGAALITPFAPSASHAQHVISRDAAATVVAKERTVLTRGWVGLWKVGSLATDDLFAVPRELLATEQGVYVLDIGTLQLHAFDRAGRKRWSAGSKGQGPGQFLRPVDIAASAGGDIAVLDPGNGRIAFYSSGGEYRRSVVARDAAQATGLCVTSDGRMQLWVDRPGPNILTLDPGGALQQSRAFPWPVPPDAPTLLRQAFFARGQVAGDCAFATLFGFGTGRMSNAGAASVTPYIEAVPMPTIVQERVKGGGARATITEGANAATAAMRAGDTVFVQFHGTSSLARAVLDLYGPGGAYLQSWRLPPCERVAYHSAVLYCMTNMAEEPTLVAFAAKADTARVLRGIRSSRR